MTALIFNALKPGTRVVWREGVNSPKAGEFTDHGIVVVQGGRRFARWQDGQETDGSDDWALRQVELET